VLTWKLPSLLFHNSKMWDTLSKNCGPVSLREFCFSAQELTRAGVAAAGIKEAVANSRYDSRDWRKRSCQPNTDEISLCKMMHCQISYNMQWLSKIFFFHCEGTRSSPLQPRPMRWKQFLRRQWRNDQKKTCLIYFSAEIILNADCLSWKTERGRHETIEVTRKRFLSNTHNNPLTSFAITSRKRPMTSVPLLWKQSLILTILASCDGSMLGGMWLLLITSEYICKEKSRAAEHWMEYDNTQAKQWRDINIPAAAHALAQDPD
jgi:hypothetical protein